MRCQRCRGLVICKTFDDLNIDTHSLYSATRCLNCGYIERAMLCASRFARKSVHRFDKQTLLQRMLILQSTMTEDSCSVRLRYDLSHRKEVSKMSLEPIRKGGRLSRMQVGRGMASELSRMNGRVRRPRRRVEDALAEQLRLLKSLSDSVSVALFIIDERQRCRFMNPAAEQLTGYRFEEMQGRPLHDVVHCTKPDVRPNPLAECSIERASSEKNHMKGEEIFVHRDGHRYPIAFTASPIGDKAGKSAGMLIEVHDISERKAAEEALRESEAMFRDMFEHAGGGIVMANLDGNFIQCNPAYCAMLGYTEDELRCLKLSELVHPEDRVGTLADIKRLIVGDVQDCEIENRHVHKNGEPVWLHKFVSLLHDQAGEPKYPVALVTDVTERCRTEQELREAHAHLQRKNIELEQAVHEKTEELRQLQERLRALTSELTLAEQRERKRLATELHDHLQQLLVLGKLEIGQGKRLTSGVPGCDTALKRVDTVFSEALTYTRTLVAELSPPVLHDHGFAAGVKWLAEYMKKRYQQAVTVVVPDGQDLKLPDDHVILLFQSVRELLINSSKYAGTREAMVRIEQCDDQLQIEVSDEGAGFDLAAVAARTANEGISSKFGLLSVQERLRALGGLFTIDSTPGQGTTARLGLRLAKSGKDSGLHC